MLDKIRYLIYNKKVRKRKVLRVYPPISSYDSPIALDSLKYMKDRLIGTLEKSEIIDTLGALALGLCNTAQMLEPMEYVEGEDLGDSHPDSDWTDKNIIPLIGSNKFAVSGKQISPMPVQKDRIEEILVGDNPARMRVDDMYRDLECCPSRITEAPSGAAGFCSIEFREIEDAGTNFYVYLRPLVSVAQTGLACTNVAALAHETSHAYDCVVSPVSEMDPKSGKVRLRSELQAYAVGKAIQDCLMYDDKIKFFYPSLQDRVEKVRRKVNGPLRSKNAFDVNDDLIKQLNREDLTGLIA